MLSREDLPEATATAHRQGLAVGDTSLGMLSACNRLLDLLNTPEDIPFLSPLIQREIIYHLLKTPQAGRLKAIATSGDLVQRTARAIGWLRANFTKPLHVEDLATFPLKIPLARFLFSYAQCGAAAETDVALPLERLLRITVEHFVRKLC